MIEYKEFEDKDSVYELVSSTHPGKEKNFLKFIFANIYDDAQGLVYREDGKLVSTMLSSNHDLVFRDKILNCSYIYGVSTHPDYRLQGYMNKLMSEELQKQSYNCLITFVEAYNPKVYRKYGFEVVGYRKRFSIASKEIRVTNTKGVGGEYKLDELVELYSEFSKHFDCYYLRDINYYEKYISMIESSNGNIVVYRNKLGKVTGYCVYYERDELIEVKELLYLDALSLYKLLRYAIGYSNYISLEVSKNERIEKLFKTAIPRSMACVMARINDYNLFNKLFICNCKNTEEAFRILKKPVLINEKY